MAFGPCKTNFVTRILESAAAREDFPVVHDQIGSPSYPDLAAGSLALLDKGATGIFHLANAGGQAGANWPRRLSGGRTTYRIKPIPSSEYPQKACRPAYSVLDLSAFTAATGDTPRPWVQALREFLFLRKIACHDPEQSAKPQSSPQWSRPSVICRVVPGAGRGP